MTPSLAAKNMPPAQEKGHGMVEVPSPPGPVLWQKSKASGDGNCVEVARTQAHAWVRDSKDPLGPALGVTRAQWAIFMSGIYCDEFGYPGMPA